MAEAAPSDSPEIIYQAVGLKKQFDGGNVAALRGVDLVIHQGEFVAIIGPSGCGKSTLLQMLGSLAQPSEGTLTYRGQSIPDLPDPAAYRAREIGFIFQSFHLLPNMTAEENVAAPLEIAGIADADATARSWLDRVGLSARLRHYPHQLSGGEQQRVALARALAPRPALLFADEPTGNLDAANAAKVADLLFGLVAEEGAAMVLVTHDPALAERADRQVRLSGGHA